MTTDEYICDMDGCEFPLLKLGAAVSPWHHGHLEGWQQDEREREAPA